MAIYLYDDGSGPKILTIDPGGIATAEACCCGECNPCCQCWKITLTMADDLNDGGVVFLTGASEDEDCLCALPTPTNIDICDGQISDSCTIVRAVVTIEFLKISYDRLVVQLRYNDTGHGGVIDETSNYQEKVLVPEVCSPINFTVAMDSAPDILVDMEDCQVYEYLDCPAYSTTDLTQWDYEPCSWSQWNAG